MSAKPVRRLTLFKIPRVEDQESLLDIYRTMPQEALKNGKPYIVSVHAGKAFEDQRAQGYTVAVVSEFASLDDFVYYDTECEAHLKLKSFAKTIHKGNMMVYFESFF